LSNKCRHREPKGVAIQLARRVCGDIKKLISQQTLLLSLDCFIYVRNDGIYSGSGAKLTAGRQKTGMV